MPRPRKIPSLYDRRCSKCGRYFDVEEANEYYWKGKLIPSKDVDMYPASEIQVVCSRCI